MSDERERAAVLAGLRLLQTWHAALPPGVQDVFTDGGSLAPLSVDEIDELSERLNESSPAPADEF